MKEKEREQQRAINRWTNRLLWVIVTLGPLLYVFSQPALLKMVGTFAFYGLFIVFWTGGQIFMFMFFMARTNDMLLMPGQAGLPMLEEYWGQPKLVEVVRQWVATIKGMDQFREIGGKPPKGLLLYGPPGSGKTYLAKCIAGSAKVPFMYLDAPSFTSAWMGIGNIKVTMRFRKAKKLAMAYGACIVYIDEIDAIGSSRGGVMGGDSGIWGSVHKVLMGGMGGGGSMLLSTLLHELDGSMDDFLTARLKARLYGLFGKKMPEPDWHVFVFGSTNIPHVLDPALLRAGRLSRRLEVGLPDRSGIKEILLGYLPKIKIGNDVNVDKLVSELAQATPADIRALVIEEGPRKAVFEGQTSVTMSHFMDALREVRVGLKNPIGDLDPKEREAIAVHESGHAVLDWLLTKKRLSITIVRYGEALGHVLPLEEKTRAVYSLNEVWRDLVVSIGGRAAEILVYGEPMRSVGGDYPAVMRRAQELLRSGLWGTPITTPSETSARVRALFDQALTEAQRLLEKYRSEHWALVEELLRKDELGHEELAKVLGERPYEVIANPVEPKVLTRTARRRTR